MTDRPDEQIENGLTRRQFITAAAATGVGAVVFTGCQDVPRREFQAQSRLQIAEDVLAGFDNWYATTCDQCGAGCGQIVRIIEGRAKKIEGNPDHPVNLGKMCVRGHAALNEQYHPDRIQGPLALAGAKGSGSYTSLSWTDAMNRLSERLTGLQGQSNAVALVTEPLRAHQAMIVDRFARGLGAQWRQFEPLTEAPYREALRRALGLEVQPDYDIANARYILSFGADFLGTWGSPVHQEVGYGQFRQGNYRSGQFAPRQGRPRGYLVQIEPHMSMTGSNADEWIWVRPGTEGLLALSMASVIVSERLGDTTAASAIGSGLDQYAPAQVAQQTGVPAQKIQQLARDFASRGPSLAIGGGQAGAYTNGTETLSAILTLNSAVGALGRAGGIRPNPPSAIANLPNAQPATFQNWQQLNDQLKNRQVQILMVHGANPVHGLPSALGFRESLAQVPFIVSFSSFMDETTAMADLILPSHVQLEEWGTDIPDPGPGYQVMSVRQPVVHPQFDTRSFYDVLLQLGEQLGGRVRSELPWRTMQDAIKDTARNLQGERRGSVPGNDFESFWVGMLQRGGWWDTTRTASAPSAPSGGAGASSFRPARFAGEANEYPFHLVVFPHNSLGTGEAAHLPWAQQAPDPVTTVAWTTWVELNPGTARNLGVKEGDVVAVESPNGRVEVPVFVSPAASPDVLAIPLGQGHTQGGRWAARDGKQRGVNPLDLLAPLTDETTGALAYGATRVRISRLGRHIDLPKFEGPSENAGRVPEHEPVIQVTRGT
jgi:menaquinone reductase, molybdopterin-binding-like subunit